MWPKAPRYVWPSVTPVSGIRRQHQKATAQHEKTVDSLRCNSYRLCGPVDAKVFLLFVDAHIKWLEVREFSNTASATVIGELRNVFATFGKPQKVVSDNKSAFVPEEMQTFYGLNGVFAVTSALFHPGTNRQAEQMV